MSISRAMSSGVSGVQTQQTAMDVIGNNIANVSTNGFKSSRTTFRDVYYQTLAGASNASADQGGSNPSQVGYGSQIGSVDVLNTNGGYVSTGRAMDCYIDGEGYFTVKDGNGDEHLTQVGNFGFDGSGNLVDTNKNFVCGYQALKLKSATDVSKVSIGGAEINVGAGNQGLDGYVVKVHYAEPDATNGDKTDVVADLGTKTIDITYTPKVATDVLTKAKLQTALQGTWKWTKNGAEKDDAGVAYTVPTGVTASAITVTGGSDPVESLKKVTESPEKIVNPYDGMTSISIGADGIITGVDKDGTVQPVGQIAIANVPNPDALSFDGNSYFKAINNTGTIYYGSPGSGNLGSLKTNGLAGSNVDLATEFSNMIITQRSFQANSKIITVSDEMLDTLVNMKR